MTTPFIANITDVVCVNDSDSEHREYVIHVHSGGKHWRISRRYSSLHNLHAGLSDFLALPTFPASKLLIHFACVPHTMEWALDGRRVALQQFLNAVTGAMGPFPNRTGTSHLPEPWLTFLGEALDGSPRIISQGSAPALLTADESPTGAWWAMSGVPTAAAAAAGGALSGGPAAAGAAEDEDETGGTRRLLR